MKRLDYWATSPMIMDFWRSSSQYFAAEGRLIELLIRGADDSRNAPVMLSAYVHENGDALTTGVAPQPPSQTLSTFPFKPLSDLMADSMIGWISSSGSPLVVGFAGYPPDNQHLREVYFTYEFPQEQFMLPKDGITRDELERLHLDLYVTDWLHATRQSPFQGTAERKVPPEPDFIVHDTDGNRVGIDCAQLALEQRREAHALFNAIKTAISEEPRERFVRLSDCMIYMWFESSDAIQPPVRRSTNRQGVQEIVDALANWEPDFTKVLLPADEGMPDPHPGWSLGETSIGCKFYAVPFVGQAFSRFYISRGFELGLSYQTRMTLRSRWKALGDLISDHDKRGFDVLLVTVGGPDRSGIIYPSEIVTFQEMLKHPMTIEKPSHIAQVILHEWFNGRIHHIEWDSDNLEMKMEEVAPPFRNFV